MQGPQACTLEVRGPPLWGILFTVSFLNKTSTYHEDHMTSRLQQALEFDKLIDQLPPDDKAAAQRSLMLYGQVALLRQPDGSVRYDGPLLPPVSERHT